MQIYMGKRGSGKTTKLIKYCYENDCVLVTPNPLSDIRYLSKNMDMEIKSMSYGEFIDRRKSGIVGGYKYVIDEILGLIRFVMGNKQGIVDAVSIDAEENNVNIIRRGNDSRVNIGGMEVTVLDLES